MKQTPFSPLPGLDPQANEQEKFKPNGQQSICFSRPRVRILSYWTSLAVIAAIAAAWLPAPRTDNRSDRKSG
jgi:hypothetical protein